MAGERLPEATQLEMRVSDGPRQRASNEKAGYSGRGGKLRLPRPVLTKKKPYDRPLPPGALDLPSSSGHLGPAPSLPVRLVGSASNLITSSASYLFDSFFKRRRTLWIGNGVRRTAETDSADMEHKEDQVKEDESPLQGPAQVTHPEKVEGKDLDLAQVEQILKQQFLSREEVKRLTDVLQARAHGGDAVGSVTEAQKMIKQVGEDPSPVQLAKAYMGKHTSLSASLIPQWQSTPGRYGAVVAGTSLGGRIKEDAFERSLAAQSSRAYPTSAAASVRMLKRRLIADDEYTVTPRGPTRRVRQKMTIVASSSPYIRQVTAATGPLRTPSIPLLQASEKTEKIMEALQEPMFSSKGKSVEEPMAMTGPGHNQYQPESSKARETVENHSKEEFTGLPSGEPCVSSYKPAVATAAPEALEKSVAGSLAASPLELTVIIPEKPKGFHMSAFFEDSSSDEEASPPVEVLMSSKAQQARPLISRAGTEQPFATTLAVEKSTPMLPSMISCPVVSHMPFVTEEESPASTVLSVSTMTPSPISAGLSVLPSLPAAAPAAISLPVLEAGTVAGAPESSVGAIEPSSVGAVEPSSVAAEASDASPATAFQPPSEPPPSATRVAEAPISVAPCYTALAAPVTASQLPSAATRVAEAPTSVAPSFTALAAASKVQSTLVTSVTSVSPVGSVALMTVPATVPVVAEAGVESPNADKQADQDAMATEPMTEEPDSSIVCSAAPSFLFGSAPTVASTTIGQTLSFGSGATSASYSFPVQSSTPSAVSLSVQFPFGSQSSSAAGQLFTFGASGSASFSGSTEPSFPFGSSAATSVSSKFPATSSAPMTFPATPATPAAPSSFSFGAPATSSSLANSTSLFGSQTTPIASSFAGTRAPAFTFSAPPTSSGTPTPTSFQFGGAGAGASSMASSPSFGGQPFTFGGQPTVAAANPFAQSGASSASPFQFVSSSTTSSQPVFSSGASTTSTFSFGAQPAASPFPFTFGGQPGASPTGQPFGFGGQPGASPTGQPFGFGGQPAAPAQSPFTLPGSTPFGSAGASGMDFGGGFSLGAAGGEKSGRKFIKAKRNGGAKRGK